MPRSASSRGGHAAARQDRRRGIRPGTDHDPPRVDRALAAGRADLDAERAAAVEDDAVGERVGHDLEVRATAHRVEVGERGVEAHGSYDVHRDRADDIARTTNVEAGASRYPELERALVEASPPGIELVDVAHLRSDGALGTHEVGRERRGRPAGRVLRPGVVVLVQAGQDSAAVDRRAAADDLAARGRDASGKAPAVRVHRVPRGVEQGGGPATRVECTEVGSGLDQRHAMARVGGQASRDDAARRTSADHHRVDRRFRSTLALMLRRGSHYRSNVRPAVCEMRPFLVN